MPRCTADAVAAATSLLTFVPRIPAARRLCAVFRVPLSVARMLPRVSDLQVVLSTHRGHHRVLPRQAISSTTPFFTAAFAFVILAKRESFLVYCSLVPVVLGVVIASGFEPSFDMTGFIACVCSTAARALKSVMGAAL